VDDVLGNNNTKDGLRLVVVDVASEDTDGTTDDETFRRVERVVTVTGTTNAPLHTGASIASSDKRVQERMVVRSRCNL
jgi:hypothetical protein